jgi:hypothetical protein
MPRFINFKDFLLDHKNIDAIIIGYFIGESISTFYKTSFESLIDPILNKITPGVKYKKINVFGVTLFAHQFIVGLVKLFISFYVSYILRTILFTLN